MITVELIRQYFYCPRKVYWRIIMPHKLRTPQIERGKRIHKKVWYGKKVLKKGEYIEELQRKVYLVSQKLNLSGIIDAVIIKKKHGEIIKVIPVEVKTGSKYAPRPEKQHIMQVIAYIILAQEYWGKEKVPHAYIIYKDTNERYVVKPDERLFKELNDAIEAIKKIQEEEQLPPPTNDFKKCNACEYRKICLRV